MKSTQTNRQLYDLCLKCSTQTVISLRLFKHYKVVSCFLSYFFSVYADGSICLDILQNRWSPTYDVSSILTSIQVDIIRNGGGILSCVCYKDLIGPPLSLSLSHSLFPSLPPSPLPSSLFSFPLSTFTQSLLDEPNPNSPANSQAAQLYQENRREYEKKVLAIVEESWMSVS